MELVERALLGAPEELIPVEVAGRGPDLKVGEEVGGGRVDPPVGAEVVAVLVEGGWRRGQQGSLRSGSSGPSGAPEFSLMRMH